MDSTNIRGIIVVVFGLLLSFLLYRKRKSMDKQQQLFTNYINSMGISENDLTTIFIVDGCYIVSNRKMVTGLVKKGTINKGDALNYVDKNSTSKTTTIIGIEKAMGISYNADTGNNAVKKSFKQIVDVANTNDKVGMEIDTNDNIKKGTYFFKKD